MAKELENLGKSLKYFRKLNQLSLVQAAEKSGVQFKQISTWENGQHNLQYENLRKLANAYNVPVSTIVKYVEKSKRIKDIDLWLMNKIIDSVIEALKE